MIKGGFVIKTQIDEENVNQKEKISYNIIAKIKFKKDTTIIKNIVFLRAESSKQIFYRICDYMYSKGYIGFEIVDLKILKDGVSVDTDLIISVPNGKLLSFDKN